MLKDGRQAYGFTHLITMKCRLSTKSVKIVFLCSSQALSELVFLMNNKILKQSGGNILHAKLLMTPLAKKNSGYVDYIRIMNIAVK